MYITIVELPQYIRRAERLLDEEERNRLIDYLATRPKSGVVMQGTGGIRKLRWARKGTGKSGGVRVIYILPLISYDGTFLSLHFVRGQA